MAMPRSLFPLEFDAHWQGKTRFYMGIQMHINLL